VVRCSSRAPRLTSNALIAAVATGRETPDPRRRH
jgi:hypothetical protein